jgi:outer membrane protein OmpA-like peptidoglycan-associated protein
MHWFSRVGVLMFTLVLSGCPIPPVYPGCEVSYVKGSNWSIAGITFPINGVNDVKIGDVIYTGSQVQEFSDTARILDIGRLSNCSVLYSGAFREMPVQYREKVFERVTMATESFSRLAFTLRTATDPAVAMKIVESIKQQVPADPVPSPRPTVPPTSSVDFEARTSLAALGKRVQSLDEGISKLRGGAPVRIKVLGFEKNGSALLAERRDGLLGEFRTALAQMPSDRTPNVLFVGYADPTGNLSRNVGLALRRAETVAEFLRRQDVGRDFRSDVTSGGVAKDGGADQARRVEIVIS